LHHHHGPYITGNQQLWDEWADINDQSGFHDVAGFKADPGIFAPVIV